MTTAQVNYFDEVVYLFQGGGAMGAFQVGVYEALMEEMYSPDWIVGISIGAINASLIAGNPPGEGIAKLEEFWSRITRRHYPLPVTDYFGIRKLYNYWSAQTTLLFGQPNFFEPHWLSPLLLTPKTPDLISFYSTLPLKQTLIDLIDFDYLNRAYMRLSIGAVDLETGEQVFFDNTKHTLTPEHIMASCALPPGFPAIKIDGHYYWDGGLYSNTPILAVTNESEHKNRLCFLVNLFNPKGVPPHSLDGVQERAKDIEYASHLRTIIEQYDSKQYLQGIIAQLAEHIPEEIKHKENLQELLKYGDSHKLHVAQINYKSKQGTELHSKDYEFSELSADDHRSQGYKNALALVKNPDWFYEHHIESKTVVHKLDDQDHPHQ
ncbi:phospholipase [Piscirickettsia salmonis]|uniref:Patatin n=1 Tax=Piscirickettsia salmonis TaxID=1238 RepID=A0A9Q5YH15_PISSA|nr:patatin-like phospholipase family protein [Piscirickettsia salmonis]ALA25345.1 patatin-like phospholipase family protein [Piscirickettsia salmonis]APS45578.1 phospholipase [Piscirickettsia salmonis]APS46234.1 phospholipase [Piscirickettsia salmonis]APS50167.1 phospholipase [Piscirickettsia salmonis]APS53366.1 phospholipase [Piscirickettsia salmonis]